MPFFSSLGSWFKKLWNHAPDWNKQAKSVLLQVAPLVVTAVTLVDADAGTQVANSVSSVKTGLAALGAVLDGAGPTANAPQIIDSVIKNLGVILQAAHVKNPDSQQKATVIVGQIGEELKGILSLIPPTTA